MSRTARLAVSAALAAGALVALVLAQEIASRHVRGDPGPAALPIVSAAIVLIGAAVACLCDLRRLPADVSDDSVGSAVCPVAAATILYLVLMTAIGYLVSTALVVAGISWGLDRQRRHTPMVHALVAVTAALASWYVFGHLLDVALPVGPWGF